MTLWRFSLRSKPQSSEYRIGGGPFGLPADPFLDPGQALGSLMNVVALGDVGKGFEQLIETIAAVDRRCGGHPADPASRRPYDRRHSFVLSHSSAFPHGMPSRVRNLFAAG